MVSTSPAAQCILAALSERTPLRRTWPASTRLARPCVTRLHDAGEAEPLVDALRRGEILRTDRLGRVRKDRRVSRGFSTQARSGPTAWNRSLCVKRAAAPFELVAGCLGQRSKLAQSARAARAKRWNARARCDRAREPSAGRACFSSRRHLAEGARACPSGLEDRIVAEAESRRVAETPVRRRRDPRRPARGLAETGQRQRRHEVPHGRAERRRAPPA